MTCSQPHRDLIEKYGMDYAEGYMRGVLAEPPSPIPEGIDGHKFLSGWMAGAQKGFDPEVLAAVVS